MRLMTRLGLCWYFNENFFGKWFLFSKRRMLPIFHKGTHNFPLAVTVSWTLNYAWLTLLCLNLHNRRTCFILLQPPIMPRGIVGSLFHTLPECKILRSNQPRDICSLITPHTCKYCTRSTDTLTVDVPHPKRCWGPTLVKNFEIHCHILCIL